MADAEIKILLGVVKLLIAIDEDARKRIVLYLFRRFVLDMELSKPDPEFWTKDADEMAAKK